MNEIGNIFRHRALAGDSLQSLFDGVRSHDDNANSPVNVFNFVAGETFALKTDLIGRPTDGVVSLSSRKWQNVFVHDTTAGNETAFADFGELIESANPANGDVVLNDGVTTQMRVIRDNDMIVNFAVVTDMDVGHQIIVVSNRRFAVSLTCRQVQGREFTDRVVVANFEAGGIIFVAEILRSPANDRTRTDVVVLAYVHDSEPRSQGHVGIDPRASTYFGLPLDQAKGADFDTLRNFNITFDDAAGMHFHLLFLLVHFHNFIRQIRILRSEQNVLSLVLDHHAVTLFLGHFFNDGLHFI